MDGHRKKCDQEQWSKVRKVKKRKKLSTIMNGFKNKKMVQK